MGNTGKRARGRPRAFDRDTALYTALKIFWKYGFEPASISELCQAMDINPPSLYAAFGNKSALFLEAARYYERMFWTEPNRRLMAEPDIHKAIATYFQDAAAILLAPDAPCGCMIVVSAINISEAETEIISELGAMRDNTRKMFADRLRVAIQAGQIPVDTDVPALAGCLNALLEGLSLQARSGIFLSELKAMASLAPRLLPPSQHAPSAAPEKSGKKNMLLTLF